MTLMIRRFLISALLCVLVAFKASADVYIVPENPERHSEGFTKFITGFFEGYYDYGLTHRVYLSGYGNGTTAVSVREEKEEFVLYRNEQKIPLYLPEKTQIAMWVESIHGEHTGTVLLTRSGTQKDSELTQYTKSLLRKKKIRYKEMIMTADVYKAVDAFFGKHSPSAFESVFFINDSDFEAIQLVNKLKLAKDNFLVFIPQKAFTSRFLSNLTGFDGICSVLPDYGNFPEKLFERDNQERNLDIYYFSGYSLSGAGLDKLKPAGIMVKGSGRRFIPFSKTH